MAIILNFPASVSSLVKIAPPSPKQPKFLDGKKEVQPIIDTANKLAILNKVNIVEGFATVCLKSNIIKTSIIEYYDKIKYNKDCFQSDDLILSNFFAMNNINSYQVYSSKANKELWWSSGCELTYGNLKDGLKSLNKGGPFYLHNKIYNIPSKN